MKEVIQNQFGMARIPFGKDIATRDVFTTESVAQARAMLELGLETEDLMLITGPIGCGKSLILRDTIAGIDTNRYQPIYLRGGISTAAELFKLVLRGMKVDPPHSLTRVKTAFFSAVGEANHKPVVILDDAQDTAPEALLAIKTMTNFESDSRNRITFILVGQPELLSILGYSHFDSLRARIRLTQQLTPMKLEETCAYIDHGLTIVGRQGKLFSDEAKMEIFKRTNGIARDVNTLCYQAILRAAIESKQIVDTQDLPADVF